MGWETVDPRDERPLGDAERPNSICRNVCRVLKLLERAALRGCDTERFIGYLVAAGFFDNVRLAPVAVVGLRGGQVCNEPPPVSALLEPYALYVRGACVPQTTEVSPSVYPRTWAPVLKPRTIWLPASLTTILVPRRTRLIRLCDKRAVCRK